MPMNSAAITRAALYVVLMGLGAAASGKSDAATLMSCGSSAPGLHPLSYRSADIAASDTKYAFLFPGIGEDRKASKEFAPSFIVLSTPTGHPPRIARSVEDMNLELPMEGYQVGAHHISPVPLPSAAVLFGSGLISLIAIGRQKRTSRRQAPGMTTVRI